MFYREAGQFKTSYKADQALFPILQDRVGLACELERDLRVVRGQRLRGAGRRGVGAT